MNNVLPMNTIPMNNVLPMNTIPMNNVSSIDDTANSINKEKLVVSYKIIDDNECSKQIGSLMNMEDMRIIDKLTQIREYNKFFSLDKLIYLRQSYNKTKESKYHHLCRLILNVCKPKFTYSIGGIKIFPSKVLLEEISKHVEIDYDNIHECIIPYGAENFNVIKEIMFTIRIMDPIINIFNANITDKMFENNSHYISNAFIYSNSWPIQGIFRDDPYIHTFLLELGNAQEVGMKEMDILYNTRTNTIESETEGVRKKGKCKDINYSIYDKRKVGFKRDINGIYIRHEFSHSCYTETIKDVLDKYHCLLNLDHTFSLDKQVSHEKYMYTRIASTNYRRFGGLAAKLKELPLVYHYRKDSMIITPLLYDSILSLEVPDYSSNLPYSNNNASMFNRCLPEEFFRSGGSYGKYTFYGTINETTIFKYPLYASNVINDAIVNDAKLVMNQVYEIFQSWNILDDVTKLSDTKFELKLHNINYYKMIYLADKVEDNRNLILYDPIDI
ncbi:hypothetical protein D3C87_1262070 [compost metagenome]